MALLTEPTSLSPAAIMLLRPPQEVRVRRSGAPRTAALLAPQGHRPRERLPGMPPAKRRRARRGQASCARPTAGRQDTSQGAIKCHKAARQRKGLRVTGITAESQPALREAPCHFTRQTATIIGFGKALLSRRTRGFLFLRSLSAPAARSRRSNQHKYGSTKASSCCVWARRRRPFADYDGRDWCSSRRTCY